MVYPFGYYHQPGRQRELHHRWHCGGGFGLLVLQTVAGDCDWHSGIMVHPLGDCDIADGTGKPDYCGYCDRGFSDLAGTNQAKSSAESLNGKTRLQKPGLF